MTDRTHTPVSTPDASGVAGAGASGDAAAGGAAAGDAATGALPPAIAKVLDRFARLGREEKMQALVSYAKRLEPLPERLQALDRAEFTVPECQTRVDLFAELTGGRLHFYADVNARQSPTIAAVLAIVLSAVNDQPPATTLAIPPDFVRRLMEGIGLAAREVGLNAMIVRLKRHAATAERLVASGEGTGDAPVLVHAP